jgi:hypothetical protein
MDPAALAELRNAGATYDFLRKKGDPAQFWEMLRLARSRRAILAPAEGEVPAPAPEVEAAIVHELDAIRNQYAPFVRDLRHYLKNVSGLPEPQDRLEMALAFLLASVREHQAVARWLAEPGKHEAKAAEKLRSLAVITDPYREALQPWTLKVWPADEDAYEKLEIEVLSPPPPPAAPPPPPAPAAPARVDAPSLDAKKVEIVGRALQCRPILTRVQADLALWETLLLVTVEPETTRAALEALTRELEGDMVKQAEIDLAALEKLGSGVTELREACAEWVQSIRTLSEQQLAPRDPREFEVGLGLLLSTPGAQDRLHTWLEDPPTWQEEVLGLLAPWIRRAQDYLAAVDSSNP